MTEPVVPIDFIDPADTQPEFPPKFSNTCFLIYQQFMNQPNIEQGKMGSICCLIASTIFLSFFAHLIRKNKPGKIPEIQKFFSTDNMTCIIGLITIGYIVIELGVRAIPFIQYKDSTNELEKAAKEIEPGFRNLCNAEGEGFSRFEVTTGLTQFSFWSLLVLWVILYLLWFARFGVFHSGRLKFS